MPLNLRHLINSLFPILILIAFLLISYFSYTQDQFENDKQQAKSANEMTTKLIDEKFYKLNRAAVEYVNKKATLDEVLNFSQKGELAGFINTYVEGLELEVQISDLENKVIFRSWDALSFGDVAKENLKGSFKPKIIEQEKEQQFAVGLKIQNLNDQTIGYIMVLSRLNESFFNEVKLNNKMIIIRDKNKILAQFGEIPQNAIVAKTNLKIIPDVWVETFYKPETTSIFSSNNPHPIRSLIYIILAIIFIFNGYNIWKSTDVQIINPILKIRKAIIESDEIVNLDGLPDNEIGELGKALLEQKNEIKKSKNELLKISNEYQKEAAMLKVLSHDLSNPLTVVNYSIYKLQNSCELNEIATQQITRIAAQVNMANSILTHVKEMKALESGKKKLDLNELTFGLVINEIASLLHDKLNKKEITLDWRVEDEKTMLVVEPVSFKASVLSNLIQNAIKFTDRGGRIEVRCREVNGKTRVDIRDFGIGIPVEMREHLFSSTSQTNRKGTEGEAGTGFGMSLVKFYITLYGGSIDFTSKTKAESETDYGTTFSIVLNTHIV